MLVFISLDNKTIKIWETGLEAVTLILRISLTLRIASSHSGPVNSVVFSLISNLLVLVSGDKTNKLWDVVSEQILLIL